MGSIAVLRMTLFLYMCLGCSSFSFLAPAAVRPRTAVCCLRMADDSYESSSSMAKGFVSGLTALVNSVMNRNVDEGEQGEDSRPPLTLMQLRDGIEDDYRRKYLWTGDIDPILYDRDPTLSFKGLRTFQKNLANLRPIIDRFVKDYDVVLYSCDLNETRSEVRAEWRMIGTIELPWRPVVDLRGNTRFRYSSERANRVVEYYECWEDSAAEVLLNLLKPGGRSARGHEGGGIGKS